MSSANFRRLWGCDRPERAVAEKESHVEIVVFVLALAVLAGTSTIFGVDTRQLEFVRQPDIARWSR
jgi:hypothetical protein